MTQHRSTSGSHGPSAHAQREKSTRRAGAHRLPLPPSALRGRIAVAAVAAGAVVAAGQSLQANSESASVEGIVPLASGQGAAASLSGVGGNHTDLEVLPLARTSDSSSELAKLTKSERLREEQVRREIEARRPMFVAPAQGAFTSGFGGRWGTTHYGIDIANKRGTAIVSVADGVVLEAGPASGFGLWVRVQHKDGTITVYGHMERILVKEGQRVKAGDRIATMGDRGFSTGVHLHFEVWSASGRKINPLPWLGERGVFIR